MTLFDLLSLRAGCPVTHPLFSAHRLPELAVVVELHRPRTAAEPARAELSNGLVLPADELTLLITEEQGVPVAGFPAYRVSSHGQVVSLAYRGRDRQRLLKPLNCTKYPEVRLSNGTRVRRTGINRLVAEAFLPPPPAQLPHAVLVPRDGIRFNLRADNLRWADYCDVHDAAAWHYLRGCSTRPWYGKLTATDRLHIAELAAQGLSKQAIARQFGVSRPTISLLLSRGSAKRAGE